MDKDRDKDLKMHGGELRVFDRAGREEEKEANGKSLREETGKNQEKRNSSLNRSGK